MTILEKLSADIKEAMKARDQLRLDTLRSGLSALKYKRVELARDLNHEEELAVLQKQVKQRSDSIAEYIKAGRTDLSDKETREREILMSYLPTQKSEEEVRQIVRRLIAEIPGQNRNQGAVMKVVMPQLKGLADGAMVRQVVNDELKGDS